MAKAQVVVRDIIQADADTVWAYIRDFNALPTWHPAIANSSIEGGLDPATVGCVRNFNLVDDGGNIREKLLGLSDHTMTCTYAILEAPMPLTNYVAELSLSPLGDGKRCVALWTAEFECAPENEEELVQLVGGGVFQGGFDALNDHFS